MIETVLAIAARVPHVWIQSEIACHRAKIASQYICNKLLSLNSYDVELYLVHV